MTQIPPPFSSTTSPSALEAVATYEPFATIPELDESIPAFTATSRKRRASHPAWLLVVLATASFMASLDLFVVNVALDPIGQGIGETSLSDLSWILNGYAIVYSALLVPAGRLSDRIGAKSGLLYGLGLFTVASLGAALSGDLWILVTFRFLQAAGAALLTPASLSLVLATAPAVKTKKYVQIWAASGSLAAAAGPAIGGFLVQASWRWVFLLNLPIGIAAIIAGKQLLPNIRRDIDRRLPDLLGGLMAIIAIGGLALGLVKAPDWGWGTGRTIASLVVAAVAVAVFVARSARVEVPIVDLHLFSSRVFTYANLATLLFQAGFGLQLLGIVLWLQQRWGFSPITVGLAVAPGPAMVFVTALTAQQLAKRVRVGVIAASGALIAAAGIIFIAVQTGARQFNYAEQILPGWLLVGVGVGLALPTIVSSATEDLRPHQAATGSAIVTMAGQIGSVLGVSVLINVLASGDHVDPHRSFAAAWIISGALLLISAVTALGISHRRRTSSTI